MTHDLGDWFAAPWLPASGNSRSATRARISALAEARALIYGAAAAFAHANAAERTLEAAGARSLASDLLLRASAESIQLHGGVGFTWEYDPHLYFKRAQASAHLLGGPAAQLERVAQSILGQEERP